MYSFWLADLLKYQSKIESIDDELGIDGRCALTLGDVLGKAGV